MHCKRGVNLFLVFLALFEIIEGNSGNNNCFIEAFFGHHEIVIFRSSLRVNHLTYHFVLNLSNCVKSTKTNLEKRDFQDFTMIHMTMLYKLGEKEAPKS